jgi:hypothetical protein
MRDSIWPWGRLSLWQKWVSGIFLGGKGRPAGKADNLTANCLGKMWEPRRLTTLLAFTACYTDSFTFFIHTLHRSHYWQIVKLVHWGVALGRKCDQKENRNIYIDITCIGNDFLIPRFSSMDLRVTSRDMRDTVSNMHSSDWGLTYYPASLVPVILRAFFFCSAELWYRNLK